MTYWERAMPSWSLREPQCKPLCSLHVAALPPKKLGGGCGYTEANFTARWGEKLHSLTEDLCCPLRVLALSVINSPRWHLPEGTTLSSVKNKKTWNIQRPKSLIDTYRKILSTIVDRHRFATGAVIIWFFHILIVRGLNTNNEVLFEFCPFAVLWAVAMAERADRADRAPGPPGERDKKDYLFMKAPGDYSR